MILKNSLYTIVDADKNSDVISYRIKLNQEHFIYKAHFPEEPVTPGVCILLIAQEILSDIKGSNITLQKIKNAKFTAVMSPLVDSEAVIKYNKINSEDNEVSTQCCLYNHDESITYAKLSFTCKIE